MLNLLQVLGKLSLFTFLVSSMVTAGLGLTPKGLMAPLRERRLLWLALSLNFLFAPAFAWLLTLVIPMERSYAIALLLIGGAAGAPFIPKLVETARADVAAAVSLMALLTIGTILFLPLALPLLIPGLQANAWDIARPLVFFIFLPLILGMAIKSRAPAAVPRLLPPLTLVANGSAVLVLALFFGLNLRALLAVVGSGAILAALIYIAGLLGMSWIAGGLIADARGTMTLVTAARNFGAALVPAATSFNDQKVTIAVIVNALVGLVVLFAAAAWLRRKAPQPAPG